MLCIVLISVCVIGDGCVLVCSMSLIGLLVFVDGSGRCVSVLVDRLYLVVQSGMNQIVLFLSVSVCVIDIDSILMNEFSGGVLYVLSSCLVDWWINVLNGGSMIGQCVSLVVGVMFVSSGCLVCMIVMSGLLYNCLNVSLIICFGFDSWLIVYLMVLDFRCLSNLVFVVVVICMMICGQCVVNVFIKVGVSEVVMVGSMLIFSVVVVVLFLCVSSLMF